jgi:hypothetical protein
MKDTTKNWLENINEVNLRKKALHNMYNNTHPECGKHLIVHSMHGAIQLAFYWEPSLEGHSFWRKIETSYRDKEYYIS